jgi:hypothetical protein
LIVNGLSAGTGVGRGSLVVSVGFLSGTVTGCVEAMAKSPFAEKKSEKLPSLSHQRVP